MIDVPVEVKDALREGRLKKNYRVVVLKEVDTYEYTLLSTFPTTYTISSVANYRIYCETSNAFDGVTIVSNGVSRYIPYTPTLEDVPTILILGSLNPKDKITLDNSLVSNVELQYEIPTTKKVTDFIIDNDNLVSESVKIDERMCSGDTLKFGLCEGSSLEFQYFLIDKGQYEANETYMRNDLVHGADTVWRSKTNDNIGNPLQEGDSWAEWTKPNITGRQIKVFVDVEYGESTPCVIPMGYFDVKNCSRQASTGIIKVVAYNKLQSDYLDAKANDAITEKFSGQTFVVDILDYLLNGYSIEREKEEITGRFYSSNTGKPLCSYGISNTSVKFTKQYGIASPLNPYTLDTWNQSFYLNISTVCGCWNIRRNQYISFEDVNGLTELENLIYQWFVDLFDASSLNVATSTLINNFSTAAINDSIDHYFTGWLSIFSIRVIYYDGTEVFYSNIGYQKGLAKCAGTLSDFFAKTLYDVHFIEIIMPNTVSMDSGQGTSSNVTYVNHPMLYDKNFGYLESEGNYVTSTWEGLKYPNGENIVGSWEDTQSLSVVDFFKVYLLTIESGENITVDVDTLPDVTARDLQSAVFELSATFGQLDRQTDLFSGVELNHSRLLPADSLYPDNALYPDGAQESAFRSQYSKLWADEGNIHKWRYLIITYKGLDGDGNETEYTLQRTVNNDGTDNYNCSDNWLFRNLVWTAEQIGEYANAMVAKMRDITWFPFEMWCAGLPYLETGDEIEIPLGNQTYTSYILQRQLKGIQNLQDTYINGTLDIF